MVDVSRLTAEQAVSARHSELHDGLNRLLALRIAHGRKSGHDWGSVGSLTEVLRHVEEAARIMEEIA